MGTKDRLLRLISFEDFQGSGASQPDVTTNYEGESDIGQGSKPLPATALKGKGAGPAEDVRGNMFQRMTIYFGGKLIEYFGDYWISTKFGSLLTDGRKMRVKHIVAVSGTVECYQVRPHDHILKIDNDMSTQDFVVLLPTLEGLGVGVGIPNQSQSYTARGAAGDDQVDRQFWGRELLIESFKTLTSDIRVRQSVDLTQAGYTWFQSGTPNEWYLAMDDGTTPGVANDTVFYINAVLSASGAVGALVAGEHGYGDNDALGFNTFYVLDATDPNIDEIIAGYGQVAKHTVLNEKFHLVSFWDEDLTDARWNVLQHTVVTTSTTTSTTSTTTTSTTSTTTTQA